jgi:hypothetical protein
MSDNPIQKRIYIEIDVPMLPAPDLTKSVKLRSFWKTRHPKISNNSPEAFTNAVKKQTDLITKI